MSKYLDGFVLIVPNDKLEEYKEMAKGGRDVWMKHGALAYYECKADDLTPNEMGDMKTRRFDEMAGASSSETVWFSFIIFESKEHRDEVNQKVNQEMAETMSDADITVVPFDMQRMAYGGFAVEVEG